MNNDSVASGICVRVLHDAMLHKIADGTPSSTLLRNGGDGGPLQGPCYAFSLKFSYHEVLMCNIVDYNLVSGCAKTLLDGEARAIEKSRDHATKGGWYHFLANLLVKMDCAFRLARLDKVITNLDLLQDISERFHVPINHDERRFFPLYSEPLGLVPVRLIVQRTRYSFFGLVDYRLDVTPCELLAKFFKAICRCRMATHSIVANVSLREAIPSRPRASQPVKTIRKPRIRVAPSGSAKSAVKQETQSQGSEELNLLAGAAMMEDLTGSD